MLMLHDSITGVEVLEQHISWDTNYATALLAAKVDLTAFLKRINFNSHALVLYPEGIPRVGKVHKGITSLAEAENAFKECLATSPVGKVMAMSDMRAHCNPTRMQAIGACCELLVARLATSCPQCGSGGFGLVATVPGLPCEVCGAPTQRALSEKHSCVVCHAHAERPRSDGKKTADSAECAACNP